MWIFKLTLICTLVTIYVIDHVTGTCDSLLKAYDTSSYHKSCGSADHNIVDELPATSARVISSLQSYGYSLCFGCGTQAIHGHCPKVAICVKGSKCYKRSHGASGYSYGCCDMSCGSCPGQCDGDFCNADSTLRHLLPTTTQKMTTPPPTTVPTTVPESWSTWSAWSKCVATNCPNPGAQVRSRVCLTGTCTDSAVDSRTCDACSATTPSTTTPPNWQVWSDWSKCFATDCVGSGFRVRTRICTVGKGACAGPDHENGNCVAAPCVSATPVTQTPTTTPSPSTTVSAPCVDDNDAITNTCSYWVNFRICDKGTASFQNIGSIYCRKTCGLCV